MLDWDTTNLCTESWRQGYSIAAPFPHLILDGLIDPLILSRIVEEWPDDAALWRTSQRGKRSMTVASGGIPESGLSLIRELNGERFVNWLRQVTAIDDLTADPLVGGGGLHETLSGGFLPLHVDFNRQEIRGHLYYRRLNVLIFLNKDWNEDWQGNLILAADPKREENRVSIAPVFNRMVIAESSDRSWHGHPRVLCCHKTISRKSIAVYYYSKVPHESYRSYHSTKYRVDKRQVAADQARYEQFINEKG